MMHKILYITSKKEIIITLIFSVLISGCYTYYGVTRPDYLKSEKNRKTKFILKNNEEIIITPSDTVAVSYDDHSIIFIKDSVTTKISFYDIKEIREEKFDFGKTFTSTVFIALGSMIALVLLLILFFWITDSYPFKVG